MLDLGFVESSRGGRIQIKLNRPARFEVERTDDRGAVLTLSGVRLPKRLERSLDTSALDSPIKMISTFPVPGEGQRVRVVVSADGVLTERAERAGDGIVWHLEVKGLKTEEVAVSNRAAAFTTEPAVVAAQAVTGRTRYSGKKVSFEFKDIDIHNLLRVIAEVSKKNIVVADDVTGKITIRLRNVPWDEALDIILASKGLGKEEIGDILRVAPLKTLEEEARLREERKKALRRQEELVVQLIPVNYAAAAEMAPRVKDVLSERGTVAVDPRTNILIVRDIASNVGKARGLVEKLDTITPQVLIESRIVEANTSFSRSIGVQWGGFGQAAPASGNTTGLSFPSTVRVTGGSDTGVSSTSGISSAPNFAVNLPAAVGAGAGGALGFTFGSASGAGQLNLRLSAAESNGTVKTISAPKVTTLQNQKASISQGVSIPFSQVSAQGVNTTFVEARLQLDVTPHITSDGSILMAIKATNNQPDPSNTGANGQPAISKKEAETQVLVKDGDTTVIGGIYVRRGANQRVRRPVPDEDPDPGILLQDHHRVRGSPGAPDLHHPAHRHPDRAATTGGLGERARRRKPMSRTRSSAARGAGHGRGPAARRVLGGPTERRHPQRPRPRRQVRLHRCHAVRRGRLARLPPLGRPGREHRAERLLRPGVLLGEPDAPLADHRERAGRGPGGGSDFIADSIVYSYQYSDPSVVLASETSNIRAVISAGGTADKNYMGAQLIQPLAASALNASLTPTAQTLLVTFQVFGKTGAGVEQVHQQGELPAVRLPERHHAALLRPCSHGRRRPDSPVQGRVQRARSRRASVHVMPSATRNLGRFHTSAST